MLARRVAVGYMCLFSFCGLELTRHRISRNVLYDYIAMPRLPTSGFSLDSSRIPPQNTPRSPTPNYKYLCVCEVDKKSNKNGNVQTILLIQSVVPLFTPSTANRQPRTPRDTTSRLSRPGCDASTSGDTSTSWRGSYPQLRRSPLGRAVPAESQQPMVGLRLVGLGLVGLGLVGLGLVGLGLVGLGLVG